MAVHRFWPSARTEAQDIADAVRGSCYTYLCNGDRRYTESTAKIRARISTAKLYHRKPNGTCGKSKTWFLILNLFQGKVNEQWLESSQRIRVQQKGAQTKWEQTVDSCPMWGQLKVSSPFPIYLFFLWAQKCSPSWILTIKSFVPLRQTLATSWSAVWRLLLSAVTGQQCWWRPMITWATQQTESECNPPTTHHHEKSEVKLGIAQPQRHGNFPCFWFSTFFLFLYWPSAAKVQGSVTRNSEKVFIETERKDFTQNNLFLTVSFIGSHNCIYIAFVHLTFLDWGLTWVLLCVSVFCHFYLTEVSIQEVKTKD